MENKLKITDYAMKYLVNILMGAVYSDKKLEGAELVKVDQILSEIFEGEIPEEIKRIVKEFDPKNFDPKFNVEMLLALESETFKDKANKRKILEFIASIHDADDVLAIEENEYLCKIAEYLGLSEEDYKDLKLEIISIEELKPFIKKMATPPPIPEEAKKKKIKTKV